MTKIEERRRSSGSAAENTVPARSMGIRSRKLVFKAEQNSRGKGV